MLRTLLIIISFICLLGMLKTVNAQEPKLENLQMFDQKPYHFGFSLGFNRADYYMDLKADYSFEDSLQYVHLHKQPGFNLGIVSSLTLSKNWRLRFLPAISFQERLLKYGVLQADSTTFAFEKSIESTFLDFPLNIKWRTNRINNFAAYLVAGGKYSLDLASQADVNNSGLPPEDKVVKTLKHDYSAEGGVGFDFFLPYFKFAIELKLSVGIPNLFIQDNTFYSDPISRLRTKLFLVSFTFEG